MSSSKPSGPHSSPPNWAPPPVEPLSAGYLSRKALPIKRGDAEPLTREDVQYDMLNCIFSDTNPVFTPQNPGKTDKVTFCELYLNALYSSSKCSKVLKDKMAEDPAFALELSKISLLVNIGRINTTMAFFPEMKTALRTYHPIPSLQKSDGNAQDAPRIKNCLKAALLPSEFKSVPPSTPEEIIARSKADVRPPTSIVNLIFVLANHAAPLANVHFDGQFNFLDLFLTKNLSSQDRARVFLWLIYRYLEGPQRENPFDDEFSQASPSKAPAMRTLTEEEQATENCDTAEEVEWGEKKSAERNEFLHRLVSSQEQEKKIKPQTALSISSLTKGPGAPFSSSSSTTPGGGGDRGDDGFLFYVPPQTESNRVNLKEPGRRYVPAVAVTKGSMLWHAWTTATRIDALVDSDDDDEGDPNVLRHEYNQRLEVISRLRGRGPTPEPFER